MKTKGRKKNVSAAVGGNWVTCEGKIHDVRACKKLGKVAKGNFQSVFPCRTLKIVLKNKILLIKCPSAGRAGGTRGGTHRTVDHP